jgi:hypothetical protein
MYETTPSMPSARWSIIPEIWMMKLQERPVHLSRASMSETEAKAKIEEDVKEVFGTCMLDEAPSRFSISSLPTELSCFVLKSIEAKEPDVKLTSDLFVCVRERSVRS